MKNPQNPTLLKKKGANKILESILQQNKTSNAYIFYGPDGVGRKSAAINFIAEIINKNNSNTKVFEKITTNNFPDFKLIEPTYLIKGQQIKRSELKDHFNHKNKPIIRVDQIREIRKFLGIKSIESEKKFIIIEDAHLLNEAASNCLLKTLEEPENGLFILITSDIDLLIETIKSRCQKVKFNRLNSYELLGDLKINKNFTEDIESKLLNLKDLIYLANGSPNKLRENIEIWLDIPGKIKDKLQYPIYNNIEILILVKDIIDEIDLKKQEFLIEFIQYKWWKETKNIEISRIIESLKANIKGNVQPRLAWEVCLLKINLNSLKNKN
mgnify:CR=1 FL=1